MNGWEVLATDLDLMRLLRCKKTGLAELFPVVLRCRREDTEPGFLEPRGNWIGKRKAPRRQKRLQIFRITYANENFVKSRGSCNVTSPLLPFSRGSQAAGSDRWGRRCNGRSHSDPIRQSVGPGLGLYMEVEPAAKSSIAVAGASSSELRP